MAGRVKLSQSARVATSAWSRSRLAVWLKTRTVCENARLCTQHATSGCVRVTAHLPLFVRPCRTCDTL